MVDQDRMTHFGLSASALPPGTHLINEQVSLFARHPLQSALGIGLFASLLALSAALAMNNAQKRRHVERLDREQALLRSLLDASPDLIFSKDAEGRFIDANQACIDLIGQPREVVIGRSDADFFPAKVAGDFVERDRQVLLAASRWRIAKPWSTSRVARSTWTPSRRRYGQPTAPSSASSAWRAT